MGGSSPWTRPSAPECGDTLKASASFGLILGGDQGNLAPGSLSTGSLCSAKAKRRLNVQSGLRKGYVLGKTLPGSSVAVRDGGYSKVLAGSGWVPSERTLLLGGRVTNDPDAGWKGGRPRVHSAGGLGSREPEDHKRLELYNDLEIHQKKAELDYHRLKTLEKRSIEHNLRTKNFEARNGRFEASAVVKNQGVKQHEQRSLGDCWQWKANGQCSKGDNCSFRHDKDKRAKSTQPNPAPASSTQENVKNASRTKSPRGRSPSGKMARLPCKDYLKGTCTTPFCEKWHLPECLFYKSKKGCRFGEECSYAHRQVEEHLGKRSKRMVTELQWLFLKEYTTIGLRISGYGAAEVFIDFTKELYHIETDPTCSIP